MPENQFRSDHGILGNDFPVELGAKLWDTFLGAVIGVNNPYEDAENAINTSFMGFLAGDAAKCLLLLFGATINACTAGEL